MNTITEATYKEWFYDFLQKKGPNPANSFFGAWAWHAMVENQFIKSLRKRGIAVEK